MTVCLREAFIIVCGLLSNRWWQMEGRTDRQDLRPKVNQGRWPSNVFFDEPAAALLDLQSGYSKTGRCEKPSNCGGNTWGGTFQTNRGPRVYSDEGGASRLFYVAKASSAERDEGNDHPTVKPVQLMRYLARLVTPPNGKVLDPFAGSGTTGIACLQWSSKFQTIEPFIGSRHEVKSRHGHRVLLKRIDLIEKSYCFVPAVHSPPFTQSNNLVKS